MAVDRVRDEEMRVVVHGERPECACRRRLALVEMQYVLVRAVERPATPVEAGCRSNGILRRVGAQGKRCNDRAQAVIGSVTAEVPVDRPAVPKIAGAAFCRRNDGVVRGLRPVLDAFRCRGIELAHVEGLAGDYPQLLDLLDHRRVFLGRRIAGQQAREAAEKRLRVHLCDLFDRRGLGVDSRLRRGRRMRRLRPRLAPL